MRRLKIPSFNLSQSQVSSAQNKYTLLKLPNNKLDKPKINRPLNNIITETINDSDGLLLYKIEKLFLTNMLLLTILNLATISMIDMKKIKLDQFRELDHSAKPRWPLDVNATILKGDEIKFQNCTD